MLIQHKDWRLKWLKDVATCHFKRKQMNEHSDIENSQNIFKEMRHCFLTESKEFLHFFNFES